MKSASLFTIIFKDLRIVYNKAKYNYLDLNTKTIQQIISEFESGVTVAKLIKKYGFNKDVISKIINTNGGNTMPISFNYTIFDKIDSPEKAY